MNRSRSINLTLINGTLLVGVAIPHLIDDFLYGIPDEFGLTNVQAQILSGFFAMLLIWIFVQVAKEQRAGLIGAGFLGLFLALAGILKHLPLMVKPGPYWGGPFSKLLILALILSGLSLFILSLYALKHLMNAHSLEESDV